MKSDFGKDWVPDWCENCNKQGIYFADDLTAYYLVKHTLCGYESLSAHCPKCHVVFTFPIKNGKHFESWKCAHCDTQYSVPIETYNHFIKLYLENELPEEIRTRFIPNKGITSKVLRLLPTAIFVLYLLYLFIKLIE